MLALLVPSSPATAAKWTFTPTLAVGEIHTDNVALAPPGAEQHEYVTEITPGISLRGEGRRLKVNADYRMQNLFYAEDSNRNDTYHQLRAGANAELIEEYFFLDAQGTVGQQIVSLEQGVPLDNINIGNRTDFYTLRLSPYFQHRFGGAAEALLRYSHEAVRYDAAVSDSDTSRVELRFASGPSFTHLGWNLRYRNEHVDRETAGDVDDESAFGELRYRLVRDFGLVAHAGYEDQDYGTAQPFRSGSYWGAGAFWQPGPRFELQALTGSRYESASVKWQPSERTSLQIGWRDLEVGSNPGSVWNASASLRTHRSAWRLNYLEETTTVQQLQPRGQIFVFVDPITGDIVPNPLPGQTVLLVPIDILGLTNEPFLRKRADASVGWRTAKSGLLFQVFNETREFLFTQEEETVYGANASWNWRFATRTSLLLNGGWQRSEFRSDREDELRHLELSLLRQIGRKASASLGYRRTLRDSTQSGSDYEENRVFIYLRIGV